MDGWGDDFSVENAFSDLPTVAQDRRSSELVQDRLGWSEAEAGVVCGGDDVKLGETGTCSISC